MASAYVERHLHVGNFLQCKSGIQSASWSNITAIAAIVYGDAVCELGKSIADGSKSRLGKYETDRSNNKISHYGTSVHFYYHACGYARAIVCSVGDGKRMIFEI